MPPEDQSVPENKPGSVSRRRAPKACLSCRARKVRCNVYLVGTPCLNCNMDKVACVVPSRASKLGSKRWLNQTKQMIDLDPVEEDEPSPPSVYEEQFREAPSKSDASHPSSRRIEVGDDLSESETFSFERTSFASKFRLPATYRTTQKRFPGIDVEPQYFHDDGYSTFELGPTSLGCSPGVDFWPSNRTAIPNGDVVYSHFRFLSVSNITRMPPQDVNFIDMQGCFRVPIPRLLDVFVKEYFLHVHPFLPLINEAEFWTAYRDRDSRGGATRRPDFVIPLVVFQAMLFASCSFVPLETIRSLGFPSTRVARRMLYRRAKLLFDHDSESLPLHLSQAALLLSYWSPSLSGHVSRPNTAWLRVAIEHAENAGAHLRVGPPNPRLAKFPAEKRRQNLLRRLWCCCIVRDRILSFCLRRNIQITRTHFDLDNSSVLSPADMEDEVYGSRVYSPATKRSLIELFTQLTDMCLTITDAGTLIFPFDRGATWDQLANADDLAKVGRSKLALSRWYQKASVKELELPDPDYPMSTSQKASHDSLKLFTNLMYIYYHSSRVAICHFQILQNAIASIVKAKSHQKADLESHSELRDAAAEITECLKSLSKDNLHIYLPTTAIACTALPLALHIMDVRLSSRTSSVQLDGLIEVMRIFDTQYDGVEWVGETIKAMLNSPQLRGMAEVETLPREAMQEPTTPRPHNWTEVLCFQPSLYLKLAMTMDLSFSKGRLPKEADFPSSIQELFSRDSLDVTPPLLCDPTSHGSSNPKTLNRTTAMEQIPHPDMEDGPADDQDSELMAMDNVMLDPLPEHFFGMTPTNQEPEQSWNDSPPESDRGMDSITRFLSQAEAHDRSAAAHSGDFWLSDGGQDSGAEPPVLSTETEELEALLPVSWSATHQIGQPGDDDAEFLASWLEQGYDGGQ